MYSGNAEVVPLVASEKNVDACVVSSESAQVYEDWNDRPLDQRRRRSTTNARYQESPSELFNSMVVHAVFWRRPPTGKNGRPSAPVVGVAVFTSLLRISCIPREPAYPSVNAVLPQNSRCKFTFQTWTDGVSTSHCTGRIDNP